MRPVAYYSVVFLEDPLRGERLNVGLVGWSDADPMLRWVFLDDLSFVAALRVPGEAIDAFQQVFRQMTGAFTKENLFEHMAKERGPYSWIGYTPKKVSFDPVDKLVEDMYRILLYRESKPTSETETTEIAPEIMSDETPDSGIDMVLINR